MVSRYDHEDELNIWMDEEINPYMNNSLEHAAKFIKTQTQTQTQTETPTAKFIKPHKITQRINIAKQHRDEIDPPSTTVLVSRQRHIELLLT